MMGAVGGRAPCCSSAMIVGWPPPPMMGAMVFEAVLVLLIPWQWAVASRAEGAA